MSLSYERVMRSPYLDEETRSLTRRYLSPQDLDESFKAMSSYLESHPSELGAASFRRHELGESPLGAPLYGWTLGEPSLPRLICASQHHGSENYGASFSLYLSHLLLKDPLFKPLLKKFSFSFLPQQNPDSITHRGNGDWMSAPDWRRFVERYQYDPRRLDVEHGVPPEWLADPSPTHERRFRRAEALAFARWVSRESELYGAPVYYQSGHAWGILDAPLYLMYPNLTHDDPVHAVWAERVQRLNQTAPYGSVATAPPLTDDYQLPDWLPERSEGFYVLPTREAFLRSNPDSQVMCSSMDVVLSRAPRARVMVIEPPIFSSRLIQETEPASGAQLSQLRDAAAVHQAAVDRCKELWGARLMARLGGRTLDEAYFSDERELRAIARLKLETEERDGVGERWAGLVDELSNTLLNSKLSLSSGHLRLATIDQYFSAANYLSVALQLTEDDELSDLHQRCLRSLLTAELTPWPVEWGVFVYLCPLLATVFPQSSELNER